MLASWFRNARGEWSCYGHSPDETAPCNHPGDPYSRWVATVERCDGAHAVGAIRLAPIDVGFDLRGQRVVLPAQEEWGDHLYFGGARDSTGIGYADADGRTCRVWGERAAVVVLLREAGYLVE